MDARERNQAIAAAWLEWKSRRLVPLSMRQYAQRLDRFVDWAGPRPLAELSVTDLERWVNLPTVKGLPKEDGSINKDIIILRGLYKWAFERGHIYRNPAIDLQGTPVRNHNPRAIPDDTWQAVWFSEISVDMRVVLGLGYYCGLRREEICRLRAEHWDAKRGRLIHFKRKGDRNSKTTGVFPVASCAALFAEKRPHLLKDPDDFLRPLSGAVAAAKRRDRRDGDFLIPWGVRRLATSVRFEQAQTNPDQINARLRGVLARVGLSETTFSPHDLRHSFVTNLLDMGVPMHVVSSLANHSSLAITQRYVKVSEDPLAQYLTDPTLAEHWGR